MQKLLPESFLPAVTLDLETTVQNDPDNNIKDNSPYNPANEIVSVHWRVISKAGEIGPANYRVLHHKEVPSTSPDLSLFLQDVSGVSTLVAHNAKYDLSYIKSCFSDEILTKYINPKKIYCTMVAEYILAKGIRTPLSLENTCIRRGVSLKKTELVKDLFKSGIGFDEMPLQVVVEYANADVFSTCEVFLQQLEDFTLEKNKSLPPILDLSFDMLLFLQSIEQNGICIDLEALSKVEEEYLKEKSNILLRLNHISKQVMGDTPINLNSGADVSSLIYSRNILDKRLHKEIFNIGTDSRGKSLRPPRMSQQQFVQAVRSNTEVCKKTIAYNCSECKGYGKWRKTKKDGSPFKKETKCPKCNGSGFVYVKTKATAGLRLSPDSSEDASANGFKTDKATISKLIHKLERRGGEESSFGLDFLKGLTRLNAVSTYLDSFVRGIKYWRRDSGLLHAQFNQTVTRTGRLSSSNPNFQNQPKGRKFPVRKCVVSRWASEGGSIIEVDYSGLEFRIAGELSKDPQIIKDILEGKDVHTQTACIINQCDPEDVSKDMRQNAKAFTFAPLYGGQGANEPSHIQEYFKEYFNIYGRLGEWHKELMSGVLKTSIVQTPFGRQFCFPDAERTANGRITNATAVVNYPVQSFATADIVPLACVRAMRMLDNKEYGELNSKIILTVHDSIVVDCYPGEEDNLYRLLQDAMSYSIGKEMKNRFNYDLCLPLDVEMVKGVNWNETEEVSFQN